MNSVIEPPSASRTVTAGVPAATERLTSLDALRGFDMLWIVGGGTLVRTFTEVSDNGVTRYLSRQFTHVEWAGFQFFDLIYPLFLFLVGISIVLSLDKTLERDGRPAALRRIARRALVLYALNFVYNGGFTTRWPDMRVVSGVLAMISVSYLLAALIYCFFGRSLKTVAAITIALLLGNWTLLELVPFPDMKLEQGTIQALAARAGSQDPAAITALVAERVHGTYEPGRNLSNYLDYRYMPGKMAQRYYENQGLLSPLTSVTLCLAGIFAGRLLQNSRITPRRKVAWLVVGGVAALAVGWLWSIELPVVKRLWTSSYCLVSAGYSALLFALFYQVVDGWQFNRWCRPLIWIGVNPITAYLLFEFVKFPELAKRLVGGDVKALLDGWAKGLGNVTIAAVTVALVLLLMRFLYQRRILLKV